MTSRALEKLKLSVAKFDERARRAEAYPRLVEALRNLLEMTDHFPEVQEFRGGYMPFTKKTARDLLNELGE